ncbi:MAG: hypothetical protein GX569_13585 [Candidatus Riflebacteria bacterium]|nr:hypothetical protein [Candidatus Riflebacteria bacterium]
MLAARKTILITISIMFLTIITGGLSAQTPFTDGPVEVKKTVESAQAAVSEPSASNEDTDKNSNIFKRIGNFFKNGFNKLVDAVKNRNKPGKLPSYISRAIKIPGHETAEFVFQGICPMPPRTSLAAAKEEAFYRYIILSYYPKTDKTSQPSQLIVIDSLTGLAIRRFALYLEDGKPYTGHAGGITVAGKYLWVASGYKLYGFDLQQIISFVANKSLKTPETPADGLPPSFKLPARDLIMKRSYPVDSTASYVSFDGEHLWVGDFVKSSDSKYGPVPHHAANSYQLKTWISGYHVAKDGMPTARQMYKFTSDGKSREAYKPDRVILCRESVQGFASGKGFVALSISYGARSSKLAFYKQPGSNRAIKLSFKPEGQSKTYSAEAWVVDSETHLTTLELPAGSEDLEFDGKVLYVGFEGASPNYRGKWTKLNPFLKIEDRFYLISPRQIKELGM